MKTIIVIALDGVMDASLAITLDTLRTAGALMQQRERHTPIRVLTAGYRRRVRTGCGLQLSTDIRFAELARQTPPPDWVVIPGMGMRSEQIIEARLQDKDVIAAQAALCALPETVNIGASCTSVFMLAATGLLQQRQVTTTWWLAQVFRKRHPDIRLDESRMLSRDGRFLTAGSAFSQLDLMLSILGETAGMATTEQCARYLLIDQRPSQARYMAPSHGQHIDPTIVALERWVDDHLASPIMISELARQLALSPRTLARRLHAATGLSPVKFVQQRRLLHASHLIETTGLSIEAIAARVGYQDGTALRKLIRREFDTTPARLRGS